MYEIIKSVIEEGRYNLEDILKKIDTIWIQGSITEEQKTELVLMAQENAKPENSYAPLQNQINTIFEKINILEQTVKSNANGMSAIKDAVEKLGQQVVVPEPEPEEEYPEFKQPEGSHDAYNIGDKITYTDGKHYESLINGNVWAPDVYPQGWKLVEE